MKKIIFICISNFTAILTIAQATNLDFENWYIDSLGKNRLYNWDNHTFFNNSPNNSLIGTWRDTNAENGVSALKLSRWYSYTNDWVSQKASISQRYGGLKGYYEYIDNNLSNGPDTAIVQMFLTKWNIALAQPDTIGSGEANLTKSDLYIPFNCTVNYFSTQIPDSVTINIFPRNTHSNTAGGDCADSSFCSFLTIDNLSLNQPTGISVIQSRNDLMIFPNPVSNSIYLDTKLPMEARLINSIGALMSTTHLRQGRNEIGMQNLPAGLYFIIAGSLQYKILKL